MDASQGPEQTPEHAKNAAGGGAAGSQAPRIESPSLVPEQGEPADVPPSRAGTAPRIPTTALVLTSGAGSDGASDSSAQADKGSSSGWRFPAISSLAATVALA